MATARQVAKSISNSAKLAALSSDGARLLFTWMILHADNIGRLRGEPLQVKAEVLPRHGADVETVENWLHELSGSDLIVWYEHQGQRFVQILGDRWNKIAGNMKSTSELPEPPDTFIRRSNGVHTVYERRSTEVKGSEGEVEVEGEGNLKRRGRGSEVDPAPAVPAPEVSSGAKSANSERDELLKANQRLTEIRARLGVVERTA